MKNFKTKLSTGLTISELLLSFTIYAQTWHTVDDCDGTPRSIAIAADGTLYVAGVTSDGGNTTYSLLRCSKDGGVTWGNADSHANATYSSTLVDPAGHVFAAGNHYTVVGDSAVAGGFLIRRSVDGGQNWETVDDSYPNFGVIQSLARDINGTLYATGSQLAPSGTNVFLIRQSSDGGATWQPVGTPVGFGIAWGVVRTGNDLYISTGGIQGWQVYKSSDEGNSWFLVDSPFGGTAKTILADKQGRIFVAGLRITAASRWWTLRRSDPGGQNWTNLIIFEAPQSGVATGLAFDTNQNLYATCIVGANWRTLQVNPDTGNWAILDDNGPGVGMSVAIDPRGNLYSAGASYSSGHWTIRKGDVGPPYIPSLAFLIYHNAPAVYWPLAADGFTLEYSDSIGPSAIWSPYPASAQVDNALVIVPIDQSSSARFFRLTK